VPIPANETSAIATNTTMLNAIVAQARERRAVPRTSAAADSAAEAISSTHQAAPSHVRASSCHPSQGMAPLQRSFKTKNAIVLSKLSGMSQVEIRAIESAIRRGRDIAFQSVLIGE
jgi:hypothetical protein